MDLSDPSHPLNPIHPLSPFNPNNIDARGDSAQGSPWAVAIALLIIAIPVAVIALNDICMFRRGVRNSSITHTKQR